VELRQCRDTKALRRERVPFYRYSNVEGDKTLRSLHVEHIGISARRERCVSVRQHRCLTFQRRSAFLSAPNVLAAEARLNQVDAIHNESSSRARTRAYLVIIACNIGLNAPACPVACKKKRESEKDRQRKREEGGWRIPTLCALRNSLFGCNTTNTRAIRAPKPQKSRQESTAFTFHHRAPRRSQGGERGQKRLYQIILALEVFSQKIHRKTSNFFVIFNFRLPPTTTVSNAFDKLMIRRVDELLIKHSIEPILNLL